MCTSPSTVSKRFAWPRTMDWSIISYSTTGRYFSLGMNHIKRGGP
jgi:hypothetical protein